MPRIRIPPTLRAETQGQREIILSADDVDEAFRAMIDSFPALAGRLFEDGALPTFLNVFVDGEDIRTLDGLATPLQPDSTVLLLPALAGGA